MERIVVLVSATFLYAVVGRASMASAEMASRTKRLYILISFHCVLSEILSGHAAAEATSKPARQPEGAGRSASPSPSLSHASGVVVGARRRRLAEGSPGEEPDPVRELLDLEEELENLHALRFKERLAFRQCVRHWGTFDAYCREHSRWKSKMAADPERMRDAFERKQARKQTACNVWAALLDAAREKIEAMDRERKQMQSRLTKEQTSQYLAAKAARGRAQIGGDSSHTAVGEAAVGASTRPPATGESPTPGDAGSLDALDNELARLRQVISLAVGKWHRSRRALKDHLERRVPSTPPGVPSPERDRAGEARIAWEEQHLQLEQDAKQAREAVDKFRVRLRELNAQKAAHEKAHGVSPGRRGCENAPVRFSRLGITVDAREAAIPWFQRPNFLTLSHRWSGAPPDPAARPPPRYRYTVFTAEVQHVSRPTLKPRSKHSRLRVADPTRETGAETKASTSTATSEPDSPGEGTSGIVAKTPTARAAKRQRRSSPPRPRSPEWIESTDSSDQESPTAGVEEFKEVASTPPQSAGNISPASPSFADVISLVLQGGSPDKETAAPAMAPQRSRSPSPPQGALTEGGGKLQISEEFSGVVGGPMPSPPRPTKRQAVPRLERSSPQGEDSSSTSALTAVRLALLRGLQPTIPAGPQIGISTPPGGRSPGSPHSSRSSHSSRSPHSSRSSESSSRSESSTTATSSDDQGSGGREERTLAGATAVPASASPPGARPQTSQPMKETLLGATSPAIELPLGGATPLGLSGGSSLGTPSLGHPSRGPSFPSSLSLFLRGRRIPFKSQLEIRGESYSPGDS